MCGRYTLIEPNLETLLASDQEIIDDRASISIWKPRYNIAPFQSLPVFALKGDHKVHLTFQHWDLIPSYTPSNTKDLKQKYKMINLKVENVTDSKKPYWNRLLKTQRCLVPVSGFYEWQIQPGKQPKKPYYIYLKEQKPFTLAGLWDSHF